MVISKDFMYRRAKNREIYKRLLQETVDESIKQKSNQRKMSSNSYKLMLKRLENSLTQVLSEVDKENLRQISFEQLGRMFFILGIFRIIQYNEENELSNEELFFSDKETHLKRRYAEMVMHEQVWLLLTNCSPEAETVHSELVYSFFRLLLDPVHMPAKKLAYVLEECLKNVR